MSKYTYAANTNVAVSRSKEIVERELSRAGATRIVTGVMDDQAFITFQLNGRVIHFTMQLEPRSKFATVTKYRKQVATSPVQQDQLFEQASRSKWRALALCIKAKLVSVAEGVESFEEAFLAHTMVPKEGGGMQRFAEVALPALTDAYESDNAPRLMLGSGE